MAYLPPEDYYRLLRLSWSGFSTYKRCPLAYKKSYVDAEPAPSPNAYNSIGGKTIQAVFEGFYNNEVWRKGKETKAILDAQLPKEYNRICKEETVDWAAPESKLTKEDLLESLKPLVGTTLNLIKEHKLLGKYSRAEVTLQTWLDKVLVHGIADFVIRREDGHIILDGKLTRHRNKYLKVDQLTFYVMLFYLQHRILVPKVGWIYYTYGELEWVNITLDDVRRLHGEIKEVIAEIRRNKFEGTPSDDACRFCDYFNTCELGKTAKDKADLARKTASAVKQQKKYEDSDSPLAKPVDGIEEIGF